ncbi:Endoglucanase 3 [Hordeum vulgare]|nr:Endoglucanase 3 [Hordeum vulgare]
MVEISFGLGGIQARVTLGVPEVQAIQYFIEGCRDGTHLEHKPMYSEPTTLAKLMAKADKYGTPDSAMRSKVTSTGKAAMPPATLRPAADAGGQQNNKGKSNRPDPRYGSKQVTTMEEEHLAAQAARHRQHGGKDAWQPKLTFE